MFGKRCTLCGGKLDNRNICKECGLDNSKSDKNYRMNQSSCDRMPMTHTHGTSEYETADRDRAKPHDKGREKRKSIGKSVGRVQYDMNGKKPGCSKGCFTVIFVIVIIMIVFSIIGSHIDDIKYSLESTFGEIGGTEEYDYEARDPYEHLSAALQEEGESVEYKLQTGRYVVGVHIPEGNYVAEVQDEFDVVQVDDIEHEIYLYEYEAKEEGHYLEDLRLFQGAIVEIGAVDTVTLTSDNAQPAGMTGIPNPLTEVYEIRDTQMRIAGKDFPAGVYDLKMISGYGGANITIYDKNGIEYETRSPYFSKSGSEGIYYNNMVFPEGAELILDDGLEITMTPSEVIESTDYLSTYMYY